MNKKIQVKIVGTQVACQEGLKDNWRDVTKWVAGKLRSIFGDQISVSYFDLFDPDCPPIPPNSQLPIVYVEHEIISSGGKISVPMIKKKIEELGITH